MQMHAMVSLRALRKLRGLTAVQLAELIGEQGVSVSADHIFNVELGHKKGAQHLMAAWAKVLGLELSDIWQRHQVAERLAMAGAA